MASLVLDASVASSWCYPQERTEFSNGVLQSLSAPLEAVAPRLWAYGLRNSVLVGLRRNRIARSDALIFLGAVKALPIRLRDPVSYDAVFDLAERYNLTVYDAAYLDLAIREGIPLASLDAELCNAATAHGVPLFKV